MHPLLRKVRQCNIKWLLLKYEIEFEPHHRFSIHYHNKEKHYLIMNDTEEYIIGTITSEDMICHLIGVERDRIINTILA